MHLRREVVQPVQPGLGEEVRRNTNPTWGTIRRVRDRDEAQCILCGRTDELHTHHRRPRGRGGSRFPGINLASNLITVCAYHHAYIHQNVRWARRRGLLVSQYKDPAAVPIKLIRHGWVELLPEGGMNPIDREGLLTNGEN